MSNQSRRRHEVLIRILSIYTTFNSVTHLADIFLLIMQWFAICDANLLFHKINTYHVSLVPYLLDKLKGIQEGDRHLLDNSLVIYGSPMGDSNLHNHRRLPLFLAGRASGRLKGNLHVMTPDGTPMANVWVSVLQKLGMDRDRFGDSTGAVDLDSAQATTTAAEGV